MNEEQRCYSMIGFGLVEMTPIKWQAEQRIGKLQACVERYCSRIPINDSTCSTCTVQGLVQSGLKSGKALRVPLFPCKCLLSCPVAQHMSHTHTHTHTHTHSHTHKHTHTPTHTHTHHDTHTQTPWSMVHLTKRYGRLRCRTFHHDLEAHLGR